MKAEVIDLLHKVRELEKEIETRLAQAPSFLQHKPDGTLVYDQGLRARHLQLRTRLHRYILGARALVLLTAPIIYLVVVPLLLLDLAITVYQAACFPVYGIEKVARRDFLIQDRAQLGYLNLFERLNCAYCSYANGLIAYVREIASRTEQYWCPIKHAKYLRDAHARYRNFFEYGDADSYRDELATLREQLRTTSQAPSMPPRCAKCATPADVPSTPLASSISAYAATSSHAGMGIGGISSTTVRRGNSMPKARSTPKTPPDAPTVG